MSNRRRPKPYSFSRPFRGNTPPNVYQTVDIGSGVARRLRRNARRFPGRKYAAVDSAYANPSSIFSKVIPIMRRRNIDVYPVFSSKALKEMIASGKRARNIEVGMPYPLGEYGIHSRKNRSVHMVDRRFRIFIRVILKLAPKLLLPGGKLFLHTEIWQYIPILKYEAARAGYTLKAHGPMPAREAQSRSWYTAHFEKEKTPIQRFVLIPPASSK